MKYVKQIDGLRFIAIFLVLIEHFATALSRPVSAGYYGVDLFFTISGFLITSILVHAKEPFWPSYKKFLGRRTLRIFPLYYAAIIVLFLLDHPYVKEYVFYFLTYTYNYAWVAYNIPENSAAHFWSLGVEEQFYLFWPFVILLLRKKENLLTILVFLLVIACFLQMTFGIIGWLNPYNLVGLIPRAGSLGMGALAAILNFKNKLPLSLLSNKVAEYILLIILLFALHTGYNIKYPVLAICSAILVLKAATNNYKITAINNFLKNDRIVYIGSISYGIYVLHFPLGQYFTDYIFNPYFWDKINFSTFGKLSILMYNSWIIKFPLYSFLSIGLAHFSFKYFEKPILKLKDKFFKYN